MARVFEELKRGNVFRVGAAYGVIGWLVLQVGDLAADNLAFPDWFMPMILVVLAIGLPVALLFAWAFELTPEGVKKTVDVDKVESITASTGQTLNYVIIAGPILIAGYFIWESRFQDTAGPDVKVAGEITDKTAPVPPFASFSEDADRAGSPMG